MHTQDVYYVVMVTVAPGCYHGDQSGYTRISCHVYVCSCLCKSSCLTYYTQAKNVVFNKIVVEILLVSGISHH